MPSTSAALAIASHAFDAPRSAPLDDGLGVSGGLGTAGAGISPDHPATIAIGAPGAGAVAPASISAKRPALAGRCAGSFASAASTAA
jgi:hypothetical protein